MSVRGALTCLGALWLLGCSSEQPGGHASRDASTASALTPDGAPPPRPDAGPLPAHDAAEPPPEGGGPGQVDAAPTPDGAADSSLPPPPYPPLLSLTGLFDDIATEALGPGVRFFQPAHILWTDGATKRRWVQLPDTPIDTSDMDFWRYPVGTKVWKEFTRDGTRVETRLLHKQSDGPDGWVMIAYAWLEDGSDAVAVPEGVVNAAGTPHDIPSTEACHFCHGNMADRVLGFSALQLSHDLPGLTLTDLVSEGRLSDPPATPLVLPGDDTAKTALGYLHANCGACHNPHSDVFGHVDMQLWQDTDTLGALETNRAVLTTVNQPDPGSGVNRIVPGRPDHSMIYVRMSVRGNGQMPPLGTERVDPAGLSIVTAFIESLGPGDAGPDGSSMVPDAGSNPALDASASLDATLD